MARKTVLLCDQCNSDIPAGSGAIMRLTYTDARRGAKAADLCDSCSQQSPGVPVARRGRKPKS